MVETEDHDIKCNSNCGCQQSRNKITRFKINIQKPIAFLYTMHNQLENVIFVKDNIHM